MEGLQLEEGDMPENNRNEIRVLVVEDEEKIALSICKKISSRASDFTIVGVAHNGEEALKMIGKFRPQVVFTDIAMPIMGGMELVRRIRSGNSNIIIVILSGYSDFSYAQQAIRYGVFNYLLKPLEDDALQETLFDIRNSLSYAFVRNERRMISSDNYQLFMETGEMSYLAEICIGNVIYNAHDEEVRYFYDSKLSGIPWKKVMEMMWGGTAQWYLADEHAINQKAVCCKTGVGDGRLTEKRMEQLVNLLKEYTDMPVNICYVEWPIPHEEIWDYAKRLRHMMKQKLVIGHDGLFGLAEEEEIQNSVLEIVKMKLSAYIRNYFISADLDNFMQEIRTILKYLQNNHATQESVEKICYYVLNLLEFSDRDYDMRFLEDSMNRMARGISISVSEEELFRNLMQEFGRLSSYMENLYENNVEKELLEYVDEHYLTIESVEQVAEVFGYNYAYLSRLFKKKTGESMNKYITGKKIELAKELLRTKQDMRLVEISDMCGYNDSKYFCRVFKNEVGMTPGEYKSSS